MLSGASERVTFLLVGAWEYHSSKQLIMNAAKKPLRIFHHNSEFDLGYNTSAAPIGAVGSIDTNNTAGDLTQSWTDGHHNWKTAGNRTAAALAAKGYKYRHVYSLATHHCDYNAVKQTLADTLVWLWFTPSVATSE